MASIRCGSCQGRHGSVAEVKACYANKPGFTPRFDQPAESTTEPAKPAESNTLVKVTAKVKVPAGRYAIEDEAGKLHFYKVDTPTEGRWAGRTFVDEVVGGGYEGNEVRYPVRDRRRRERVLAEIAEDPYAALTRYGKALEHCGICGRELTDTESRKLGIGPVCASKL